jgi:hypothetical protein
MTVLNVVPAMHTSSSGFAPSPSSSPLSDLSIVRADPTILSRLVY